MDDHIRWKNARYFNEDSNAARTIALINQFSDYEAVKEHLIIRPLNYDDNEKALSKEIYRQVGDIALVLYISLGDMMQGTIQNVLSSMVRQDMFQIWGIDETEVFDWALENTIRSGPADKDEA